MPSEMQQHNASSIVFVEYAYMPLIWTGSCYCNSNSVYFIKGSLSCVVNPSKHLKRRLAFQT